jgi:PIN domain nuclease of toxin-antitoxin system
VSVYVLDTSALLTSLYEEPGKERVDQVLLAETSLIGAINLAEFASKCADAGMRRGDIETIIKGFDAEVIEFNENLALETGLLRPLTRQVGLSLGDRGCLALAKSRQAIALTADRDWIRLAPSLEIKIECVRPQDQ